MMNPNSHTTPTTNSPPGDLAIWVFILAELAVFGVLFAVYAFARRYNLELFDLHQQHLNRTAGLVNTVTLITSSYFVVRAVAAIKEGDAKRCGRWLWSANALGLLFILVKGVEYQHHFSQGIGLSTNLFYTFYIGMTFFHFMHVLMGMVILFVVAHKAGRGGYTASEHTGVETGASYWHMVDLVWIILFPLVYVMH
ncbi:MAG: cytochrome c oxidase subunit 3 family protein [Gammaproteobacteria bacterium]|nr:cytochrome c oxidase subunit 3 family protein [Gammaproteobacteria bacterium]